MGYKPMKKEYKAKKRKKICREELELKIAETKLRIDIKFMVSDMQDNVSTNLWDELDVQIMAKKEKV